MRINTSRLTKAIYTTFNYSLPLLVTACPMYVYADAFATPTLTTSQSDFGGIGLMQLPSGRVAPEGEFNFSATVNHEYRHAAVSLQLLPWLETTIRYTQVPSVLFNSNYEYSGDTDYTDKGIDFKIRLLEESYWLPETSVGVRDFGGTGLFDGEFIAATKRFGNLDLTLGLGWGYLGERGNVTNPLCELRDSFCTRDSSYTENGGSVDYQRWGKGPTSLFGGIEYQTPYDPLRLKLEYEGNDYSEDFAASRGGSDMTPHTPWNFGLVYAFQDWANLRVSYERGDTLTVGVTMHTNFNQLTSVWRDDPKPDYAPQQHADNADWDALSAQLSSNAGYRRNKVTASETNITLQGEQGKYRNPDFAQERAALLLSQYRPDSVKTYTIIESNKDMQLTATRYDADTFDKVANHGYIGAKFSDARIDESANTATAQGETVLSEYNKRLSYGLEPTLAQSFGGPESFYLYSLGINANAGYRLLDNLQLDGSIFLNLMDNYDKFNYIEDSPHISNFAVPRVRTLFRYYVHDHPVRMKNLQLTWFEQLSDSVYFQAYGGYLETMFAGVGSEILYRPENASWAIGADVNLISQRNPDNWFSLYSQDYFEYDSGCSDGVYTPSCAAYVLKQGETGFVNLYYMPRWELMRSTRFKLSVGQFLGQDKGARIDFSKQFDSGIITGAYASLTDLTADEYGEGSFNKGFYISLPLDILTVKPSRTRAQFAWQPITRDGGQMLNRKYELFNETDARSPWFTKPENHKN